MEKMKAAAQAERAAERERLEKRKQRELEKENAPEKEKRQTVSRQEAADMLARVRALKAKKESENAANSQNNDAEG